MAKKITKKPSLGVKNLGKPTRESGTHKMKAEWKVPADLKSTKKNNRATGLKIEWSLNVEGNGLSKKKDPHKVIETGNESKESSVLNLNDFKAKAGGKTVSFNRDSFHPRNKGDLLKSVSVKVTPYNGKGDGSKSVTSTRKFERPPAPTIDSIVFNENNDGKCNTTIRRVDGNLYQEQDDIIYRKKVYTSSTKTNTIGNWQSSNNATISVSHDVQGYMSLSYTNYIKVTWQARSRGYRGNSPQNTKDPIEKSFYVSYPVQATINSVSCPDTSSSGRLTVAITIEEKKQHPVDIVTLELLKNVTYATAEEIPNGANWEDSGAQDNGKCTAITISSNGLKPDSGKHTWVRVKTARNNAPSLCRYSAPMELEELSEPLADASDDKIVIKSVVAASDGKSAIVNLLWDDGAQESTGTELSWAEDEDTWESTESPDIYEFTWAKDGESWGGYSYPHGARITVKNLKEATKYYIKARRYVDDADGVRTFSGYSPAGTVVPHKTPDSVVAVCDRYVAINSPLSVRWTLSGSTIQTEWKIVTSDGKDLGSGRGSIGSAQINASRLRDVAISNEVTFKVWVSTGSEFKDSNECKVSIIEKPTLSLSVPSTMTVQNGFTVTATSNKQCELIVVVTSQGAGGQTPTGMVNQTEGDTIYSNKYAAQWDASGNNFTMPLTFPAGSDFMDKGTYTVTATAIDPLTGLKSDTVSGDFTVAWAHQAVSPENNVALTVVDEYTEDGEHKQAVRISLTPPSGSAATDVYDIYRMDVDNPTLIGTNFPLTYPPSGSTDVIEDLYAPFGGGYHEVRRSIEDYSSRNPSEEGWYEKLNGAYSESTDTSVNVAKTYYYADELFYRVALRTADGDVEFSDIPYVAPNEDVRFDWADGTLELHYGNSYGDSYTKDFEIRHHMDGSNDGYWNPNVERKSSLNSSVIKIVQPDEIRNARRLARYAGPVFVRLPDGSAYEANVQVTDLSKKNDAVVQIAIDATEIGLTQEFALPNPYRLEQGE